MRFTQDEASKEILDKMRSRAERMRRMRRRMRLKWIREGMYQSKREKSSAQERCPRKVGMNVGESLIWRVNS